MRYMMMHKFDDKDPAAWSPTPDFMARMGAFVEEATKAGVLLVGDGLRPTAEGAAQVTVKDGKAESNHLFKAEAALAAPTAQDVILASASASGEKCEACSKAEKVAAKAAETKVAAAK